MIALAGCAKRNADRELARVLALIRRRADAARDEAVEAALRQLRDDLAVLEHRDLIPDLPPFEADRTR